ncbi:MAG: SDR family oxidoreductase [Chloroflexi bacterium]|nr:MAG: SDR family oxidoreductase [Chloroflexota bacterium]
MDLGLRGRTAVITGGSTGIGKAAALGFAAEGVNLVLLSRTKETLEAAADEIRAAHNVEVFAIPTDITDSEAVNKAAAMTAERFGAVHILVNNAGHRMRRLDRQIFWDDDDWLADINGKTVGMLRVLRAFLPQMVTDGTGSIINVGGIAGTSIYENALTHGLNNSAMHHITGYMAYDFAAENIRVNAVIPGLIATEWRQDWADMMAEKLNVSRDEFLAQYCAQQGIIAGRWGQMKEVADTIVFLASDRASYINGTRIAVDGGFGVNPRVSA